MKLREQTIINEKGRPVSVVLSIRDYQKLLSLLADVVDNRYIARHRKDLKRPFSDFLKELQKNSLV